MEKCTICKSRESLAVADTTQEAVAHYTKKGTHANREKHHPSEYPKGEMNIITVDYPLISIGICWTCRLYKEREKDDARIKQYREKRAQGRFSGPGKVASFE